MITFSVRDKVGPVFCRLDRWNFIRPNIFQENSYIVVWGYQSFVSRKEVIFVFFSLTCVGYLLRRRKLFLWSPCFQALKSENDQSRFSCHTLWLLVSLLSYHDVLYFQVTKAHNLYRNTVPKYVLPRSVFYKMLTMSFPKKCFVLDFFMCGFRRIYEVTFFYSLAIRGGLGWHLL